MKRLFKIVAKERMQLSIVIVAVLIILKIVFYKETFAGILKFWFALLWLFMLPGYTLTITWHKKISFIERVVIGTMISAAITGVLSYYIGLLGIPVKAHWIFLPIILIAAGMVIFMKTKEK